jgi:hypothetical protein
MGNQKVTTTDSLCTVYMVSMHRCAPVPMPAHYDLPEQAYWGPGASAHAFTGTVLHRGLRIAQEDHDLGAWLWHVPFFVMNILLPLEMMNSSRKMMFAASTVKMNGAPTGCSNTWSTPMLACSLVVSMPAYPDNDGNSVLVGMTSEDLIVGWVAVGLTVAVDLILFAAEIAGADSVFEMKSIYDSLSPFELLATELGIPVSKGDFLKIGVGAACGAIKIWRTGEGTIELSAGGVPGGGGIKITRTKDEKGQASWAVEGELGIGGRKGSGSTGSPRDAKREETDTNWSDGSSKTRETTTRLNTDGSTTKTVVEEEFDGEGRKTGGRTTTTEYDADGTERGDPKTEEDPPLNAPPGDEVL